MKILQFGKHYPPDLGGIESVISILTRGLNAAGIRTDVLCASTRNRTETTSESGFTVTRVASWGKFASTALSPGLIWRFLRLNRQYDIIHVHMPDPLAIVAVLLARSKARIVLHWHGDVDFAKFRWLGTIYKPFNRMLIRRADKVVLATHAHLDHSLDRDLFAGKAVIIPFPLDPQFAARARKAETSPGFGEPRPGFHIFAIGRLIYYKGFSYLVESAKFLPDDCEITIGGSGPLHGALEQQIRVMGLQHRVRLTGRLSDDELLQEYGRCDVFCLPSISRGEMFGMVQLEAMCLGKPVVSTRIPGSGVAEVNIDGETGLVVPIQDAKALADAFMRIRNEAGLREGMSRQARARAHRFYSSDVVIPQVVSLYHEMLAGPSGLQPPSP